MTRSFHPLQTLLLLFHLLLPTLARETFYFQTGPPGLPPTSYTQITSFDAAFLCPVDGTPSSTIVTPNQLTNCGSLGEESLPGSGATRREFTRFCCNADVYCALRGRGIAGCCERGNRCEEVRDGDGDEMQWKYKDGLVGIGVSGGRGTVELGIVTGVVGVVMAVVVIFLVA
ncbi:hypothetical protein EX30DRAFT_362310 [Ascodesmis nigricans]|uniref:Uncharacterized protein n=1 Tax=Ascodesmis nigricans TaxID=341454 RepID=A0A4S2N576_9PEZI|nr:hypothetical protein EX30DRAFT_362310 [Ascodesmis nigricans]